MKKQQKCYIYTRVSTAMQVDGFSLDAQKEKLKKYADYQDMVVVREFSDEGKSGKNVDGRPQFKEMLELIEAGTDDIDYVLVFKLSRFGRNAADVPSSLQKMQDFGVNLICVEDGIDSSKDAGKLMISVLSAVAEIERDNILVQTMEGRKQKAREGKWNGGFAPYGYLKSKTEKNRIVVDEATAGNVRLIYKLFLDGKGYTPIAKYLNEQGIMSPLMYLKSLGYQQNVRTNGVWTKTTVKSILTNQAYIGSAVHGKVVIEKYNNIPLHATDPSEWVVVENTHEPLIDKKTFEKAQERVKEISDAYFAKEFTKHPPNEMNLLKGKIVCGDCGKGMRLSPRTTKSYVYFCGTFSDGINPACSRHKIDQEEVNKAVFAQISNHMRCCIDALKVIRELNARSSGLKKYDVYEKAITRQRRELEKVNRKFSELYGDYSEHLINESEYLTLKQQYLLKSEALKKEIDNLLVSQNLYSKNYKIDADWENLINKYLKCRKLNKELADAFVDKVQVFEGGRISVNLVYDDCLEELLQVKNKREGDLNE